MPVFRHALAIGHAPARLQLVADQRCPAPGPVSNRLVDLGKHRCRCSLRRAPGADHVVDRLALLTKRRIDDQQACWMDCGASQHIQQLAQCGVSRWAMPAVSISTIFLLDKQLQQVFQRSAVMSGVHGHAEDAAIGAQLLVSANPVGVQRDQAEVASAEAGGKRGGDLGRAWWSCPRRWSRSARTRRPALPAPGRMLVGDAGCGTARWPAQTVSSAAVMVRRQCPRPACAPGPGEKPHFQQLLRRAGLGAGWRCSFSMKARAPKRSSIRPFIEPAARSSCLVDHGGRCGLQTSRSASVGHHGGRIDARIHRRAAPAA